MSNFTNTKIKDTFQRVLQIDNGEIQDGLGLPVDARIQSIESDLGFTGDLDGTATLAVGLTSGDKIIQGNLDVIGRITAIEIYAQYESSSIIFSSGSTKFGDTFDDTHQFTGSVLITGSSFLYNGYNVITSNDTGSIVVDSASYAIFADTASHLLGSVDSASYAQTASYIQLSGVDGFTSYSSSVSSRVSNLENFSSSLDATFATDAQLNAYTASANTRLSALEIESGSIRSNFNSFTASYTVDSASFSNRISASESDIVALQSFSSSLDATFATDAELNAATVSLSSSIASLSSSYLNTSSSFSSGINANSSSISALSSSFISFSASYNTGSFTGSFAGNLQGTSSWATNAISSSHALSASQATSASYALTASYVNPLIQDVYITGSLNLTGSAVFTGSTTINGLTYPTADNGEFSFLQTDGSGNLTLQYVKTVYEVVFNGEATQIVKGTPVYISGSQGANSKAYRADAGNPTKMPVVYVVEDNIDPADTGRAIALGLITGVNTTGFPGGTEIYVAVGGGFTSTRPTGSAIVQVLGYVTKEGNGGQGVILNPGPANLPNITSGSVWVGNSDSVPVVVPTSSLSVASASFASTASFSPDYLLLSATSSMLQPYVLTSQTSSMSVASASYVNISGVDGFVNYSSSVSTRIVNLENFSSSLDATFATDAELNAYTASANIRLTALEIESGSIRSSFNSFTSSFITDSASFSSRISTNESDIIALQSFSSSLDTTFATDAQLNAYTASTNTRLNFLEIESGSIRSNFNTFTSSYNTDSSSFSSKISTNTTNIANLTSATSSYVLNSQTGSFILASQTSSMSVASASVATSASYALTASFALNSGGGAAFPFTGSAIISGSLTVTGSANVQGAIGISKALIERAEITISASGLYTIYSAPTSSYRGIFADYTLVSTSPAGNARAGNIMSILSGSQVRDVETRTSDIGSTAGVDVQVNLSGGNLNLQLNVVTVTTTWNLVSLVRII